MGTKPDHVSQLNIPSGNPAENGLALLGEAAAALLRELQPKRLHMRGLVDNHKGSFLELAGSKCHLFIMLLSPKGP
jgi:hypothetical protein